MKLSTILEQHKLWLEDKGGERADLYGANLSEADLYGANLSEANLSHANLYGADLYGADLSRASLYRANLSRANLSRASLYRADLYGANLSHANLSHANLSHADLYEVNLSHADLSHADLSEVNLYNTIGNMKEVKTLLLSDYIVNYTKDVLQIGCKRHPINDWWEFDQERISEMDENALTWWNKWREIVKTIIEMEPAQ